MTITARHTTTHADATTAMVTCATLFRAHADLLSTHVLINNRPANAHGIADYITGDHFNGLYGLEVVAGLINTIGHAADSHAHHSNDYSATGPGFNLDALASDLTRIITPLITRH